MIQLEAKIEALLFFKNEPISIKRLAELLQASKDEIIAAKETLKTSLVNRGIVLMEKEEEISLGTSPEMSQVIESIQKEDLNKDLSKAALETLSIILYKNGASRADIDYIRGVNSSFTLRALSIRGLIEKTTDPKDSRRYMYKPSFELLAYMGVASVEELPEFTEVNKSIESGVQSEAENNEESL